MYWKKVTTIILGLVFATSCNAVAQTSNESSAVRQGPEIQAIDKLRDGFLDAYEKGSVDALMRNYDKDATFSGTLQPFWLKGEREIRDLWTRYFAAWSKRRLVFRETEVRFYGGGVSVETGYMEMYMANEGKPPVATFIRYSITRYKSKEGWKIANMNVARLPGGS